MHDLQLPLGDLTLGSYYRSASQRTRVISEAWIEHYGYCLHCDSDSLRPTLPNTPARDFQCEICSHPYELKSAGTQFNNKVVDGAYASMMRRVSECTLPSFLLLHYSKDWTVRSVLAIHHTLITPAAIERRKPLAATAKRAGWVGCNILLSEIPPEGRIPIIEEGRELPRASVREQFRATDQLATLPLKDRTWTASLLLLLHRLDKVEFSLGDAYTLEQELGMIYPQNKHVRPKIRQQLQVLRDKGLIKFLGAGRYSFARLSEE